MDRKHSLYWVYAYDDEGHENFATTPSRKEARDFAVDFLKQGYTRVDVWSGDESGPIYELDPVERLKGGGQPSLRDRLSIDAVSRHVADALSDDLRKPKYRGNPNAYAGHCYVASEALFHLLGGAKSGAKPMNVQHEGDQHWFLRLADGTVVDVTSGQFKTPVPYASARGRGFLTKEPSKRALEVIRRVEATTRRGG